MYNMREICLNNLFSMSELRGVEEIRNTFEKFHKKYRGDSGALDSLHKVVAGRIEFLSKHSAELDYSEEEIKSSCDVYREIACVVA